MKIAILYIGIGKYIEFFEDFYKSCEQYFFPQIEKEYFLFTDNNLNLDKNINILHVKNEGWPNNTLKRFEYFIGIKDELKKFSYIYFFNSNYLFQNVINEEDNFFSKDMKLVTLCWNKINNKESKNFTYERNKKSKAYIPYDQGEYYYQGGFYGGETNEFFKLCEECLKMIEEDKKNNYIAIWHDESYLNRYLLDKNPKRVNEIYGMPEEWLVKKQEIKALLRDKNKILGRDFIYNMKQKKSKSIFKIFKIFKGEK